MPYEKLYNASPLWVQNFMCSVYGYVLYKERYTDPWRSYYEALMRSQLYSADDINILQTKRLICTIADSVLHVPYYRNLLRDIKKNLGKINPFDILAKIPILEKNTLRENSLDFLSERYKLQELIKVHTSGTTGTPMTIYIAPNARKENYAFFSRAKRWAGIKGFEKSITLAGRLVVAQSQNKPPFWRRNFVLNNTIFSSYHLSDENLKFYVEKLRKLKPKFIDSYPSSLYPIASYMLKSNILDIQPQAIITSAETLMQHQRDTIEKAFSCKVFDQYGSAEQVVFINQCEKGSYHLNPEYGYLEVVDKNNRIVADGELGEFVCTGFTNNAMPLIRYKIGDLGSISKNRCSCGINFPVIEKIVGRIDDALVTPEGKYIGRLDPIFKGMENCIKETQIIQRAIDFVEILIVKGHGYQPTHGNTVLTEFKKRIGDSVKCEISYVDKIPRTKNGKFRTVISELKLS